LGTQGTIGAGVVGAARDELLDKYFKLFRLYFNLDRNLLQVSANVLSFFRRHQLTFDHRLQPSHRHHRIGFASHV